MQSSTTTNPVMLVTVPSTAATQHSTTTKAFGSGDILAGTLLMFAFYAVILVIGTVISIDNYKQNWRKRVEHWVDRECEGIERIGKWFVNRYWQFRCLFLKRWWQKRKELRNADNFGMSWEGNEKAYLQRYAQAK